MHASLHHVLTMLWCKSWTFILMGLCEKNHVLVRIRVVVCLLLIMFVRLIILALKLRCVGWWRCVFCLVRYCPQHALPFTPLSYDLFLSFSAPTSEILHASLQWIYFLIWTGWETSKGCIVCCRLISSKKHWKKECLAKVLICLSLIEISNIKSLPCLKWIWPKRTEIKIVHDETQNWISEIFALKALMTPQERHYLTFWQPDLKSGQLWHILKFMFFGIRWLCSVW